MGEWATGVTMREWSCTASGLQGKLRIPFSIRGSEGSVAIERLVNDDPHRLGYHLLTLPQVGFSLRLTHDIPTHSV